MTLVRGRLPVSLHTFYFSFKTTFKAQMKKNRADSKRVQTKGVLVRWLCNSSITIPRIIWPRRDKVFTVFFFFWRGGDGEGKREGRILQLYRSFTLSFYPIYQFYFHHLATKVRSIWNFLLGKFLNFQIRFMVVKKQGIHLFFGGETGKGRGKKEFL